MNLLDSKTSNHLLKTKTFHKIVRDKELLDTEVNTFIKDNKILEEDIVEIRTLCCAENIYVNDNYSISRDKGEIFLIYILIYRERCFEKYV